MNLAQRDRQVIWHPYTHQKDMLDPIPIIKGEGVYLIDENGNKYIDAISSWWVNLHGHAHPYIAEKIYEQAKTLEQVIFAGFTHEPAVKLAERLLPLLPGNFSKIFYSDNGSTAVEVAIKMALQYWSNIAESGVRSRESGLSSVALAKGGVKTQPRNKILALNNSYHGDTFGAMSVSDRGVFTLAFHDKLFEVIFIDAAYTPDSELLTPDLSQVACFIYEPLLQGAGSMRTYDSVWLEAILKKCKEHNVICIADEVMTGFGRTGKLFASEYCETKPDIICLSKGLTGGTMALGVTACTEKIYNAFVSDDKLKTFYHGHSFTANPLACTAALASLDLLQKPECDRQRQMIESKNSIFLTRLTTCLPDRQAHHLPTGQAGSLLTKNHRQLGTILAFEIDNGKDGYLNTIGPRIIQLALSKGVYLRPLGNTLYIMPPYCISEGELQKVYDVIEEILKEL